MPAQIVSGFKTPSIFLIPIDTNQHELMSPEMGTRTICKDAYDRLQINCSPMLWRLGVMCLCLPKVAGSTGCDPQNALVCDGYSS